MFNVGGGELLLILLLALLVLGPDKLPDFSRKVGRAVSEVRRMSAGFQHEIRQAMDLEGQATTTSSGPRLVPPPADPAGGVDPGAATEAAADTDPAGPGAAGADAPGTAATERPGGAGGASGSSAA